MSNLELSLYNWQNDLGFYEIPEQPSRNTFVVGAIQNNLSIHYKVEFSSNSKEINVTINYIGNGEFSRFDREYISEVFTIIKDIIEDTLSISIRTNLFMDYVFNKVQRGTSKVICKMYINIKDLIKFL
jgi:viroplasmin and RNaseH domain-containing protein